MSTTTTHSNEKATIRPLPEVLVNQIAAGEVVERPSSVLKELLENSLDALSTQIEVLLIDGGVKEVTIIDNGIGMNQADMEQCYKRHTTSKLSGIEDLDSLTTFGFRGEAISAIASVSSLTIQSRQPHSPKGLEVRLHNGDLLAPIRPIPMSLGTRLCIKGLFKDIPARAKFLRSTSTEFSHCKKALNEVALAHPEVSFTLVHQGKIRLNFRATSLEKRIREVLKIDWKPLVIEDEADATQIKAYLSPSDQWRSAAELSVFVNFRPVKDRLIMSAVRNAYQSILGPNHLPMGVVYLYIRPDLVDVNVHPQKTEVRIINRERLYSWINALVRKHLSHPYETSSPLPSSAPPEPKAQSVSAHTEPTLFATTESSSTHLDDLMPPKPIRVPSSPPPRDVTIGKSTHHFVLPPKETVSLNGLSLIGLTKEGVSIYETENSLYFVSYENVFVWIQQHLFLEHLKQGALTSIRPPTKLLVELSPSAQQTYSNHEAFFTYLGFRTESFGESNNEILQFPTLLQVRWVQPLLLNTLSKIKTLSSSLFETQREVLFDLVSKVFASVCFQHKSEKESPRDYVESLSQTQLRNLISNKIITEIAKTQLVQRNPL